MMLGKIKSGLSWLKSKITGSKVKRKKQIGPEDQENINEQLDKARGEAEAKAAKMERKYDDLKESVEEREEVDVADKLSEEKEELSMEMFRKGTSLKKFFKYSMERGQQVYVRSANGDKVFGTFEDIILLPDGRLAVTKKQGKGISPVITGRTFKDILRNPNLKTVANTSAMNVNLNRDGGFVENIESRNVPDIIVDEKGNFVHTQAHTEELQKLLAEKQQQIQKWRNRAKTAEQAWIGENQERKSLEKVREVTKTRADKAEDDFTEAIDSAKDIIRNNNIMHRAMQDIITDRNTLEDLKERLYDHRGELQNKMADMVAKNEEDLAKEDVQELAEWVMKSVTPEKMKMQEKEMETQEVEQGGEE